MTENVVTKKRFSLLKKGERFKHAVHVYSLGDDDSALPREHYFFKTGKRSAVTAKSVSLHFKGDEEVIVINPYPNKKAA